MLAFGVMFFSFNRVGFYLGIGPECRTTWIELISAPNEHVDFLTQSNTSWKKKKTIKFHFDSVYLVRSFFVPCVTLYGDMFSLKQTWIRQIYIFPVFLRLKCSMVVVLVFALSFFFSLSSLPLVAWISTCFCCRILGWISSILNGIAHTTNSSCNTNCAQYILFHLLNSLTVPFFFLAPLRSFVRNQLFFVWNFPSFFFVPFFLPK